jgi:predicted transcriptional regulator
MLSLMRSSADIPRPLRRLKLRVKGCLVSEESIDFVGLTAELVSAYVSHNPVPAGELPKLIDLVTNSLRSLDNPATEPESLIPLVPAVSVKKSITPDYIFSLEDGKPYKSLKRHLSVRGLSPDDYRAKWNLRSDYPMVAPSYAKMRSELAKKVGLGTKSAASQTVVLSKKRRGRPPKAM